MNRLAWWAAAALAACGGSVANGNGSNGDDGGSRANGANGTTSDGGARDAPNPCAKGTPTFLVPSPAQDARSVATDGVRVYFTTWGGKGSQDGGSVLSAPVGGGAPTTLATGEHTTTDIAVDAKNVYWMNYGDALRMMPKNGGAPVTLFGVDQPMSFAIDEEFAYVTTTGGVWRVAIAGGAPQKIADARASEAIAVDAEYVYWIDRGSAGDDATSLSRVPKAGGASRVLLAGPGVFSGVLMNALAVDATNVYWVATRADGIVAKTSKEGGPPMTLASSLGCPYTLRVDGDAIFFADGVIACGPSKLPPRAIDRVATGGGAASEVVLAEHQGIQGAFAIDARNVYFTGGGGDQRGIWCAAR